MPLGWFAPFALRTTRWLNAAGVPVLVMHGKHDAVIPFALGYASALAFGFGHIPALVGGAALCATSIGISARVLSDLGRLETLEGRVVLGAAVLDDIVGLIILAYRLLKPRAPAAYARLALAPRLVHLQYPLYLAYV